jgi:hypothetical protein
MPRVLLPTTTLIGKTGLSVIQQVIGARQTVQRMVEKMDAMVGSTPVLLEADPDALVPQGQGVTVYNDFVSLKATLDGVLFILAKYDRG